MHFVSAFIFSLCLVGRLFVVILNYLFDPHGLLGWWAHWSRVCNKFGGPTLNLSHYLFMGFLGHFIKKKSGIIWPNIKTTLPYIKQIFLTGLLQHHLNLYFNSYLKWSSTKELKRIIILFALANFARNIKCKQEWNLNLSPFDSCWVFSSLYTT